MSHYGKNAAVIFRVIGCCLIIWSLIAVGYIVIYALLISDEKTPRDYAASGLLSSITYTIVGVVLYALSKPLAALITRGLRDD